jgi:hypothetical protein
MLSWWAKILSVVGSCLALSCCVRTNRGVNALLWAYGNEYEVVNHYLDQIVPLYTHFNVTEYHDGVDNCPERNMYKCHEQVSNAFAPSARLWTPQRAGNDTQGLFVPDCDYDFSFLGTYYGPRTKYSLIGKVSYEFHVQQLRCKSTELKVKGGSTFDMFAHTKDSLATCASQDFLNNSYMISCETYVHSAINTSSPACIQLTVLLEHEHFDAYSLVILSESADYPSISHILLDNVTFCSSHSAANKIDRPDVTRTKKASPTENSASIVAVYSGIWRWQDVSHTNHLSAIDCAVPFAQTVSACQQRHHPNTNDLEAPTPNCPPTWRLQRGSREGVDSQLWGNVEDDGHLSPSLLSLMRPCLPDIVSYLNRTGRYSQISSAAPSVASSLSLPIAYAFWPIKQTAGHRLEFPKYPNIDRLLATTDHGVVFLGASHCRYLFLGTLQMVFGHDAVVNFSRKDEVATHENYHFYSARHADLLINRASQLCEENAFPRGTVIFSTGDWDLITGISRVLRVPRFFSALVTFLQDLLEGRYSCPSVEHVVFVTGMPYPVCTDNNNVTCATERRYRTNSAIAALNEYYVRTLTKINVHPSKKLSIVDAFSVIFPRMLLNGNFDISCGNHFNCAVAAEHGTEMIFGASGTAVLQDVLHALTS